MKPPTTPQKTPKKRSKRGTPKKTLNKTPKKESMGKTTPKRTPNKRIPKPLPKSPISESMRQRTISEFFRPIGGSQSVVKPEPKCVQHLHNTRLSETAVTDKQESVNTDRRTTRASKKSEEFKISPILGPMKRKTPRNVTKNSKKVRIESKSISLSESNLTSNDLSYKTAVDVIDVEDDIVDNTHYETAKEFQELSIDDSIETKSDLVDNKLTNSLDLNESSVTKRSLRNRTTKTQILSESKANKKDENQNDSDDELVPVFRRLDVTEDKQRAVCKENNKFVDKDKQKKLDYLYKNFARTQTDKEMLGIQSVDELDKQLTLDQLDQSQQLNTNQMNQSFIKPIQGIDFFCQFLSEVIPNSTQHIIDDNLTQTVKRFGELPFNRFIDLLPLVVKTLDENEKQSLILYVFQLIVSSDEDICNQLIPKNIDFLFDNNSIVLSAILKQFYQLLYSISMDLSDKQNSDTNPIRRHLNDRELKRLSNAIQMMSTMFNKCLLKLEIIDTETEVIQLLIVMFGLGVDFRLITNDEWITDLVDVITVLLKHIFITQLNAKQIVDALIRYCTPNDKPNIDLSLRVVSLFPLNCTHFELKRKFCIHFMNQSFLTKKLNDLEIDLSLQSIHMILNLIDWKQLGCDEIHAIILLISQSMNFPDDLIDYKETISQILSLLSFQVNACVPKSSDFEFNDIDKLLVILRTKVSVSTKRF